MATRRRTNLQHLHYQHLVPKRRHLQGLSFHEVETRLSDGPPAQQVPNQSSATNAHKHVARGHCHRASFQNVAPPSSRPLSNEQNRHLVDQKAHHAPLPIAFFQPSLRRMHHRFVPPHAGGTQGALTAETSVHHQNLPAPNRTRARWLPLPHGGLQHRVARRLALA